VLVFFSNTVSRILSCSPITWNQWFIH